MTRWRNWKCSCAWRSFKSANQLVGWPGLATSNWAVDRSDAAYQAKPEEVRKGQESIQAQGVFGCFPLARDITTITPAKTKVIIPRTTLSGF